MEILSDATFRGATTFKKDVSIDGGNFSVTHAGTSQPFISTNATDENGALYALKISPVMNGCSFYALGQARINGSLSIDDFISVLGSGSIRGGAQIYNNLNLEGFNTITVKGKSITFPSTAGTLALTSQIPTIPSDVAHVQSLPINFDVAADCTRFYVPGANGVNAYSLQMFKWEDSNGICGYYLKNVDLAVVSDSNIPGSFVVVEKSSSFAISASDNYTIRMVYGY